MRIQNEQILRLVSAVGDLDARRIEEEVVGLLAQGLKPLDIRKSVDVGMRLVGEYFRSGEYFLADLLFAGRMYKGILELKGMRGKSERAALGAAVIGTAPGDGTDLLTDILACTLKSLGFEVFDIGSSASLESFGREIEARAPRLVAVGCAQASSARSIASLVASLRERVKDPVKIAVGGSGCAGAECGDAGADFYFRDAMDGLELCMSFM